MFIIFNGDNLHGKCQIFLLEKYEVNKFNLSISFCYQLNMASHFIYSILSDILYQISYINKISYNVNYGILYAI